jgi:hypothetical protein
MSNKKQTAVEWLENEIESISIQVFDGFITFIEFMEQREQLFKKAKEMEKQQIIGTWNDGLFGSLRKGEDNSEQYYNETFNK